MEDKKKGSKKSAPDKIALDTSIPVSNKDRTFHYLPHNFSSSEYEKKFFEELLQLKYLNESGIEVYYNGNRHLGGFTIECYVRSGESKQWHRIGNYTTDFLLIKRDGKNKLNQLMMIETKGKIYEHSPDFQDRQEFVDKEFVKQNNKKFGYEKFNFICLTDDKPVGDQAQVLETRAKKFFH